MPGAWARIGVVNLRVAADSPQSTTLEGVSMKLLPTTIHMFPLRDTFEPYWVTARTVDSVSWQINGSSILEGFGAREAAMRNRCVYAFEGGAFTSPLRVLFLKVRKLKGTPFSQDLGFPVVYGRFQHCDPWLPPSLLD